MDDRCKRDGCGCEAQADGYCSDACRTGATMNGRCACDHRECG